MNKLTTDFFTENEDRLLSFGKKFIDKLNDDELIDKLAEKDLEKLARVWRLLFDKLDEAENENENQTLSAIIDAFGNIGGDKAE